MPSHSFQLQAVVATLENGDFWARALFFPELSAYGEDREAVLEDLRSLGIRALERLPPRKLHQRQPAEMPNVRRVTIEMGPEKSNPGWRKPVQLAVSLGLLVARQSGQHCLRSGARHRSRCVYGRIAQLDGRGPHPFRTTSQQGGRHARPRPEDRPAESAGQPLLPCRPTWPRSSPPGSRFRRRYGPGSRPSLIGDCPAVGLTTSFPTGQ